MADYKEWLRIASEPATDDEIESYKREACPCLPCMEKLRLIARIEQLRGAVARLPMNERKLEDIRKRNEERKQDPRVNYQRGCSGRTRGVHTHDDHCAPPVTVDIDRLLAEVERLQYLVKAPAHVAVYTAPHDPPR